ncbi:MAG: MATE family efflux transporter, partial [Candidatus Methanomethylicia archaeon]
MSFQILYSVLYTWGLFFITFLSLRNIIFSILISVPPEIFNDIMDYSGVIALDVFLNYISFIYTTLLQSVGDTRRPAIVNVIAVTTNVAFDPLLIFGIGPFPRLGVIVATAYSIGFVVMDIVDGALWGFVGANSIMVGQNLGAGNIHRAREVSYKSALLLFGVITLGSIIL